MEFGPCACRNDDDRSAAIEFNGSFERYITSV